MPDVTRDADRPQTQSATYGAIEVRAPEGELDEVVGEGFLHLEQMSDGHWWFSFTDKDGHTIHCNLWGTGRIVRDDDDPEYEVVGRVEYEGQVVPAEPNDEGRKWKVIPPRPWLTGPEAKTLLADLERQGSTIARLNEQLAEAQKELADYDQAARDDRSEHPERLEWLRLAVFFRDELKQPIEGVNADPIIDALRQADLTKRADILPHWMPRDIAELKAWCQRIIKAIDETGPCDLIPPDLYVYFQAARPKPKGSLKEGFKALYEAGGKAWDNVENPQALLDELRGRDSDAELTALRSQLAGVQGALADAGDVLAQRTDGDYGASVREVVEQRDAAREQVAEAGARWNASLDALVQCQEKLTARDEEVRRLREAMHADNLPPPPIQSVPPDVFVEAYGSWYHGKRAAALLASPPDDEVPPTGGRPLPDKYVRKSPRTYVGDGNPPPEGVWLRNGKYNKETPYLEACVGPTCRTVPGVQYTFVGPVPEEEGK